MLDLLSVRRVERIDEASHFARASSGQRVQGGFRGEYLVKLALTSDRSTYVTRHPRALRLRASMKDLTQSARSEPVRIAVSACEIAAGVVVPPSSRMRPPMVPSRPSSATAATACMACLR